MWFPKKITVSHNDSQESTLQELCVTNYWSLAARVITTLTTPLVSLKRLNALRACVYIYIRQLISFRAPTLWFIDLTVATCHIQYTFLSYGRHFFHEKTDKTRKCSMSPTFSYHTKMTADINTGAQGINTERASLTLIPLIWKMFVKSVRRSVFCYNIMRPKLLSMSCSWRKLSIKWLTSPILLFIVSLCSKLQTLLLFDWLFCWMTS